MTRLGSVLTQRNQQFFHGAKVKEGLKAALQSQLGIFNEGGSGSYLGLPECFSGSKVNILKYINDKHKNRLSGWFARSLSLGGKESLLNQQGHFL